MTVPAHLTTTPVTTTLPSAETGAQRALLAADATDPSTPRVEYLEALPFWDLITVLKEGTLSLRAHPTYLPTFETEDPAEYKARVNMTYLDDHYPQAVNDLVGMAFTEPPQLNEDVDAAMEPLLENITGEGDAWDVFLTDAFEKGMDFGHGAIWTDKPPQPQGATEKDVLERNLRPFWTCYTAKDIVNWRTTVIGGIRVLTMVVLRERVEEPSAGGLGTTATFQYRIVEQDVVMEGLRAVRLAGITYRVMRQVKSADGKTFSWGEVENGPIIGPKTIPLRVFYGGEKKGVLYSRPHLYRMAETNLEEVQVKSDLANVMHKCNVPTPWFSGRTKSLGATAGEVVMGRGIDLDMNGKCGFLEPTGGAIDATMNRIKDIREQMKRQGGSLLTLGSDSTATEVALYAKQRHSRLKRAVRSLTDAANAALGDMAEYLGLPREAGGSIRFNVSFAGKEYDVEFVRLVGEAYDKGALPLDVYLHALDTGKLPEEFKAEEVALRQLAEALRAKRSAEGGTGDEGDLEADDEEGAPAQGTKPSTTSKRIEGEGKAAGGLGGGS